MYPSRLLLVSFLAVCSTSACSDDGRGYNGPDGPYPDIPTGVLELGWSIEGRQDAAACDELTAASFQVAVIDRGFLVDVIHVPCADFETSITLYIGRYLTRSTLVDETGYFAVQRLFEDYLPVGEGQVTRFFMDFPSLAMPIPIEPIPIEPNADAGAPPEAAPPEVVDAGVTPPAAPDAAPLPDAPAP